jgi:hypothetical protein
MSWTPHRWATIWAVRLDSYGEHPQCRIQFQRAVRSCREELRAVMPDELLDLIEKAAASDDADELRRLVPRLIDFAQLANQ